MKYYIYDCKIFGIPYIMAIVYNYGDIGIYKLFCERDRVMNYSKHYLTNVIFRIDYVAEEEGIREKLDPSVRNACLQYFPIQENTIVENKNVTVNPSMESEETIISVEKFTEWNFWGRNREKRLLITKNSMLVDFNQYMSFENFKEEFLVACEALKCSYPNIKINRIGLRYIDQIRFMDTSDIKSWKSYWNHFLSSDLVSGLHFPDNDKAISRHMTSVEMNYGDYMLRFQYGIFNTDYPAPNKKKEFILDTDVYSVGIFELDEIEKQMDSFHEKSQVWFEKSIKEPLRAKMGGKQDE